MDGICLAKWVRIVTGCWLGWISYELFFYRSSFKNLYFLFFLTQCWLVSDNFWTSEWIFCGILFFVFDLGSLFTLGVDINFIHPKWRAILEIFWIFNKSISERKLRNYIMIVFPSQGTVRVMLNWSEALGFIKKNFYKCLFSRRIPNLTGGTSLCCILTLLYITLKGWSQHL